MLAEEKNQAKARCSASCALPHHRRLHHWRHRFRCQSHTAGVGQLNSSNDFSFKGIHHGRAVCAEAALADKRQLLQVSLFFPYRLIAAGQAG